MTAAPYILLVDDEPHNLLLLEDLLAMEGYQTRSARCGVEALAIAQDDPPTLILLDVMMPDMDGFALCQQLRSHPHLQTVPILFLTALDDDESRLQGLDSLGDDYLTKPIQTNLVLTKISSLLRLSQLRQRSYLQTLTEQETLFRERQVQFQQQMAQVNQTSERLSETLKRFVPEQFLSRLAPSGAESLTLGALSPMEVTILFCDIRNFTAITESQTAQVTFTWLNALFSQINQVIGQQQGFIDKYLGDAVMAVFDRSSQHRVDALNAALMIRQSLQNFNLTHGDFGLSGPIEVGIGIHSGQAVIGTLGAQQRMDTTVIGDVVNTAARLEELTKTYHHPIICSENVVQLLPPDHPFIYRWIDTVTPRGKQNQISIYALLGKQDSCPDPSTAEQISY